MARFSDLLGDDEPDEGDEGAPAGTPAGTPADVAFAPPEEPAGPGEPDVTEEERTAHTGPQATGNVFASLAEEQARAAADDDETAERIRTLGLADLPRVDDDLLPSKRR